MKIISKPPKFFGRREKMHEDEIKKIFSDADAIITDDHFVYAQKSDGWYHGSAYVNKDAIYPYTRVISPLCKEIANYFKDAGVEVVVGPTIGGVSLSQWVSYHLASSNDQKEVLAVFAEEEDVFDIHEMPSGDFVTMLATDFKPVTITSVRLQERGMYPHALEKVVYKIKVGTKRIFKRGYDKVVKGKKCLVVEDIINSGATVQKTIKAIRDAGGDVVGVGALCNRSGGTVKGETLSVPVLHSLLNIRMRMIKEDVCHICREKGEKSVRTDLGKGKEFLVRKGLL